MKVLILAGGFGTRLSEETKVIPKPMVEIGDKPIIWHIMKIYSHYGFNDFVVLCGYKGYVIKEYFANYMLHQSSVKFDYRSNKMDVIESTVDPWQVTLLDTGLNTLTGGRIKRSQHIVGEEPFLLTYGDGVANVDINDTIHFHKKHGKLVTMTSVQPEGRFGVLTINDDFQVENFIEKPKGEGGWINGGFFVCEPDVFHYIDGDQSIFEKEPLQQLAIEGQLFTYHHNGFWKCMDTMADKIRLNDLWDTDQAKWKVWKE